jgi:hypothetical protein
VRSPQRASAFSLPSRGGKADQLTHWRRLHREARMLAELRMRRNNDFCPPAGRPLL